MNTVLLPAAGEGRRLGGEPKQFRLLGGKPLLVQTLRAFEWHPDVDALVVAVPEDARADVERDLRAEGLAKLAAVVAGGATRQASVARALAAAPRETEVVLVHDAVRPFVPAAAVADAVRWARAAGAAALAVPLTDTLRRGTDEAFGETVPREGLWRMQTPQAFRVDILREAHASFGEREETDEVALVRRAGHAVRIVAGSAFNVKVTTPSDWAFAQALWPAWIRGEGAAPAG